MLHVTRATRFLFAILVVGTFGVRAQGVLAVDRETAGVLVEVEPVRTELLPHQPLGLSVTVTNRGEDTIDFEEYPLAGESRIFGWCPETYGTLELRIVRPDGTELRTRSVYAFSSWCGTVCPIRIEPNESMERQFLVAHAVGSPMRSEPVFAEPGEYSVSAIVHRPGAEFESDSIAVRVVAPKTAAEREPIALTRALSEGTRSALFASVHFSRWEAFVDSDELDADLPILEALADSSSPLPYREYARWLLADMRVRDLSARIGKCYRDRDRDGVLALLDEAEACVADVEKLCEDSELPEFERYLTSTLQTASYQISGIARTAQSIPVSSGSPDAPVEVEVASPVNSIGLYELLPLSVTIKNAGGADIELQAKPFHGNESRAEYVDVEVKPGWCLPQFVITRPDGQVVWTARTADFGEREYRIDVVEPGVGREYAPVIGIPVSSYTQRGFPLFSEPGEYEVRVVAHFDTVRVQSEAIRITVVDTTADLSSELEAVGALSASGKRALYSLETEKREPSLDDADRRLLKVLSQGKRASAIREYARLALSREAGRRAAEVVDRAIRRQDSDTAQRGMFALESSIRDVLRLAAESPYPEVRDPATALHVEFRATMDYARESFPNVIPPERQ